MKKITVLLFLCILSFSGWTESNRNRENDLSAMNHFAFCSAVYNIIGTAQIAGEYGNLLTEREFNKQYENNQWVLMGHSALQVSLTYAHLSDVPREDVQGYRDTMFRHFMELYDTAKPLERMEEVDQLVLTGLADCEKNWHVQEKILDLLKENTSSP